MPEPKKSPDTLCVVWSWKKGIVAFSLPQVLGWSASLDQLCGFPIYGLGVPPRNVVASPSKECWLQPCTAWCSRHWHCSTTEHIGLGYKPTAVLCQLNSNWCRCSLKSFALFLKELTSDFKNLNQFTKEHSLINLSIKLAKKGARTKQEYWRQISFCWSMDI